MDTKVGSDRLGVGGDVCCKIVKKLDMETKDLCLLSSPSSMVDNGGFGLRPITPESNKEGSEVTSCFTSPLTLVSSHMNVDDDEGDNPSTPKDVVFDPFAPGPDSLMLAPRSVKYLQESRNYVERRLNFNSMKTKNDESALEDDMLLVEAVYDSLLECIISKQAEDILGEISAVDSSSSSSSSSSSPDALMTPFGPRLTGISETCPDAPLKPVVKKSRYIDHSLCRKLELDFAV
ncbi:putative cyclin-dependent protein kinase inhibitor SMR11/SMR16 [Helianthus annuus]|nr:putative cyclin-dependent protein kinase inhibitor SMR11/SMR16 [Helianthus annuus]